MSNSTLYLMHHGIKGQSWGVKNGPPYPLEVSDYNKAEKKFVESGKSISVDSDKKDTNKFYSSKETYRASTQKEIDKIWKHSKKKDVILPKGTNFYRVGDKNEQFGTGDRKDIYATPSLKDNKDYRGLIALQADRRYNYTYSTNKDVRIASKETVARTILEMCNNDKNAAKNQQTILDGKRLFQSSKKLQKAMNTQVSDFDNMSNRKQKKIVDTIIRNTTGKESFGTTEKNIDLRFNVEKALREKGYSGMVDSIDIKTTGRGNDKIMENAPMVLFDSDSFSLRSTEKIR